MATGDLEQANGVMKIVGGAISKQYEESPLLYNRMSKGRGKKLSDRGFEIPTHLTGNYNHRFMTDGGDHAAGGSNKVKRATVYAKHYNHAMRLTGTAMRRITSGDVAYIKDWADFNVNETVGAAHKMCNIYGWGTGNGRLATISTGANSITQTVSNNDANRYLRDGLRIDIISTDGVTVRGTQVIDNAAASSTTFTLVDTAISSTTGDYVVAAGSFNLGVTGIRAIIDDTTDAGVSFQGLSRNTYTSYRANRVNAGSVGLDVSFMRRLLGAGIHIKAGELNRKNLEIWTHPAQTAAYSSLGRNLKRYEGKAKALDLGFTVFEFEGIPFVEDVDAPKDELNFIDWSTMGKYEASSFKWDDTTGSIFRQVPSSTSGVAYKDEYEAYYGADFNYGCTKPNSNGWVDGLSVPTGF